MWRAYHVGSRAFPSTLSWFRRRKTLLNAMINSYIIMNVHRWLVSLVRLQLYRQYTLAWNHSVIIHHYIHRYSHIIYMYMVTMEHFWSPYLEMLPSSYMHTSIYVAISGIKLQHFVAMVMTITQECIVNTVQAIVLVVRYMHNMVVVSIRKVLY